MLRILTSGTTKGTSSFLQGLLRGDQFRDLQRYGQMGVDALSSATPRDSGITSESWDYEIHKTRAGTTIIWTNSNVNNNARIALLIQYGHGTGTGGYVEGYDYINPAIRPIFDQIATRVWEKVTRA